MRYLVVQEPEPFATRAAFQQWLDDVARELGAGARLVTVHWSERRAVAMAVFEVDDGETPARREAYVFEEQLVRTVANLVELIGRFPPSQLPQVFMLELSRLVTARPGPSEAELRDAIRRGGRLHPAEVAAIAQEVRRLYGQSEEP